MKAWEQAESGKVLTPTVAYLARAAAKERAVWSDSADGMIRSFQAVAAG